MPVAPLLLPFLLAADRAPPPPADLERTALLQIARDRGWPVRIERADGGAVELASVERGLPRYLETFNASAADTISTDDVQPGGDAGFGLDGAGVTIGVWDSNRVRASHQEFGGRALVLEGTALSSHATHVAGTLIASGANPLARGMAPAASVRVRTWLDDAPEMAAEAEQGLRLSNHSYGPIDGWYWDAQGAFGHGAAWHWFGDLALSAWEDAKFGRYAERSAELDAVLHAHPHLLAVFAAGNNRDDAPAPGTGHWVIDPGSGQWVFSEDERSPDGPHDCLPDLTVTKNGLTVGAVDDVVGGWNGPDSVVMSAFSDWGPADDGRIKPDLVANGVVVRSSTANNDSSYFTYSGTSHAAPGVAGSLGLALQWWRTHRGGEDPRAATLKALAIGTADECGPDAGPDAMFGWGLMNTRAVLELLAGVRAGFVGEGHLPPGGAAAWIVEVPAGAARLRATLAWTDPAGAPQPAALDPLDPVLVHDLELRLVRPDGAIVRPWRLDPQAPEAPATRGANRVDTVERIDAEAPDAGRWLVRLGHAGALAPEGQAWSIVVEGGVATPACLADLDASGAVDFDDLLQVLASFGPCAPEAACVADLDDDGAIDLDDLQVVLDGWGCG